MELGLRGRVAAITGGSRGLGLAIATALASEGCRLAICGRTRATLSAARGITLVGISPATVTVTIVPPASPAPAP